MAENFIFTMQDLRKVKGGKDILKGIYLSFLPGREDRRHRPQRRGQVHPAAHHGHRGQGVLRHRAAGPLRAHRLPAQEPRLDESLTVKGNVELGLKPVKDLLDRFNAVSAKFLRAADRRGDGEAARRAGPAPGLHRRRQRLGAGPDAGRGHGRPPAPARRGGGEDPLRRREAPGGPVPGAAGEAGPPPDGRAHQPPRRGVGGVAGAGAPGIRGHGGGGDPRPVLPGQRRAVDPRAGQG